MHICIGGWRKFHAEPLCFFIIFWWQKIAFESSLDVYFHPFIIEFFWLAQLQFKMKEKIHAKQRFSCFSWEGIGREIFSLVKLYLRIWI